MTDLVTRRGGREDRDEKIGSVDDLVLGKDNKADESVGGSLGMGNKLVAVP